MSTLENELQDLREKNNELVKKVQYWKMTAAQKENEKLELMKETNELRLKLSRLRSGGDELARKLDAAIQSASEQAISQLVQASSAVTRTVQLAKTYMQERQELETANQRWSSISNTPSSDRVHRVPPLLIGGQSIQPVVSLSRTMGNVNNLRSNRSPNNSQSRSLTQRAVPMHVLQDFSILLTRIDANNLPGNNLDMETDADDTEINNSTEDLGLDDSTEQAQQESPNISDTDDFDDTPRLDPVTEDVEPESEEQPTPRPQAENPLEGPSWMLNGQNETRKSKFRMNLEPDSTTECDDTQNNSTRPSQSTNKNMESERGRVVPLVSLACEFSPTVRRRKRAAERSAEPRRNSNNGRILKVLVSKLRLDEDDVTPPKRQSIDHTPRRLSRDDSPRDGRRQRESSPKRLSRDALSQCRDNSPSVRLSRDVHLLSFDAPSPNGATTSHVIVSESTIPTEAGGSGEPAVVARKIKQDHKISRDSKHDRTNRDNRHDNRDNRHDNRDSRRDNSGSRQNNLDNRRDDSESRNKIIKDSDNTHDDRDSRSNNRDSKHESRDTRHDNRDTRHDNRDSRPNNCDSKHDSRDNRDIKQERGSQERHDSDSSGSELAEGRTRRARKAVTYKEKPLNRKMRR
ncbi:uncharacterized protein [Epargyreus clarus]|uniref:uncharacterized protein isoform X2 n=1 Tax=Epargyreus clarus TaxID=520877 RepID=UPI003C2FD972